MGKKKNSLLVGNPKKGHGLSLPQNEGTMFHSACILVHAALGQVDQEELGAGQS